MILLNLDKGLARSRSTGFANTPVQYLRRAGHTGSATKRRASDSYLMALVRRALVPLANFLDLALRAERRRAQAGQALDFPGQVRLIGIAARHRGQGERIGICPGILEVGSPAGAPWARGRCVG